MRFCHSLGNSNTEVLITMSPVKSQGRTNATRQRAEAAKKGNLQKNVRQNGSKASQPPSKVHKGKQKSTENSPTLEDRETDVKSNRKNKENLSKKGDTEQNGPQKQGGRTLGNGITVRSQLQRDKDGKITGDTSNTTKLKPSPKTRQTKQGGIKPGNKRNYKMSESEEEEEDESESDAESSVEVTGQETSSDEKEEERRSNREPAETQGSEESSEEESEASHIQRGTDRQTANEESDKELSEEAKSRSDSEIESVASSEEEEEKKKESEESEAATSDGGEDREITQEDKSEKPRVDKACRRPRRTPRPSKPSQGSKSKMFKKTKADKQAEKAEKQRAKAERQRLEKEAKQKAKEEKKNKKKAVKEENPSSATEEAQPPKGLSLNKAETAKGKTKLANKAKNIQEKKALLEAASADPEAEEEEEDDEPTLTKAIKGQNKMMLLTAKGKDLKAILEPEEEQDTGSVVKGQPKSFLLGKAKMVSLKQKANKMLVKPDEETSECEVLDGGSNKPKERLVARRKGMTTLRRVSGWIQKNVPRGLNLRKKLSAWSKAIGVSRWLSLHAIKQKQGARKSKGNIFKHRMAMTVASKSNLGKKKNKNSSEDKEKANLQGKSGEGGEEAVLAGEKEVEAKYAVVLPRMNRLGKAKAVELPQAVPGPSTPLSTTGSPGEVITLEPKPPKPGARLVLPVKPDLSLLKSIKKPLPGVLTSGGDVAERSPGSSGPQEGSSNTVDRNRRAGLENQDGVSVLQAARRKLDPSQINLAKMSLSGGTMAGGAARANRPDPERETAAGLPRPTTQPFPNGEASSALTGVRSLYEEEADREVAQLMGEGGIYSIPQPEVHWAGNPRMSGDPQVCVYFWWFYRNHVNENLRDHLWSFS